jgi:sigma-E factor negative regulatory protein RseC
MNIENQITHTGRINQITQTRIFVSIVSESACAACHAKGFCNVSDMKEKIIEVKNPVNGEHKTGDWVTITTKQSMGLKAVFYGYILPFIVLMATLLTTINTTGNEGLAGLLALLVLVPYYFALYLMREKLKSKFEFRIS